MTYEQGDAQTHPFARGHYDVAISRFGAMFFPDPSDNRRPLLARRPHPTKRMLERANFCGVSFDDVHEPVFNGHVIETALAFVRSRRSTCDALARLDPAAADRALERLRGTLAAHRTGPDGVVFDSRAWIITARRPRQNRRRT